ncbi:UNVERIFIED_CONTAM: hypothetical protein GTU68_002898 [Idotea baltica]|jgi:hypothetical protein
MKVA